AAADAAGARLAGVRRGRDPLAALRRRVLALPRLLLPSLAAFGRPTDHRRLGLAVDPPAGLWGGLPDRAGGCPPPTPVGGHRPDRRRTDPRAAWASPGQRDGAAVCVRRRLRLRPAHLGPRRRAGRGAGAAALGSLLLR